MDTGEQAIRKLHPHWLGYMNTYVAGLIFVIVGLAAMKFEYYMLGAAAVVVGALVFTLTEVLRKAVTYYVLDAGVARGYSFFSTSRRFAEYGSIQNVEVEQSFIQKMLGIGSVSFDTSGSDNIEVYFEGVYDPYGIEQIVRGKMAAK
jgi:uncharacterized membrane protein YdbT with pleckstrin-like domain